MKILKENNYTLLLVEEDSFVELKKQTKNLVNNNLLVQLSENVIMVDEKISFFVKLATSFKEKNKSFVLIKKNIDPDDFPEYLSLAPSLQEAEDILEMEAIERDLGL